jgi:hypothetical protein
MIHLNKKVKEICDTLNKKGYMGVYVSAHHSDMERDRDAILGINGFAGSGSGEMTLPQFEDWLRDYVCFTVEPDLYSIVPSGPFIDEELVSAEIHYKFWASFNDYLRKELGEDVTINFRDGCSEFEVTREKKEATV